MKKNKQRFCANVRIVIDLDVDLLSDSLLSAFEAAESLRMPDIINVKQFPNGWNDGSVSITGVCEANSISCDDLFHKP